MQDSRLMSEEDIEKNYLSAVETVDGSQPERAVQMLEDFIVRACKELAIDNETVSDRASHAAGCVRCRCG